MTTASKSTPWLCGPTKNMAAAWFRALSSSRGFKLTEFSRSSESPAFSTMAFCAWITESSPSSSPSSVESDSHLVPSVGCAVPWNPWMTALSPSPKPSMVSASTTDLFIVISLSTANFCTTFSSNSVSLLNALLPCGFSRSSSESWSSEDVSSSCSAISVTDWKIVEAIFRTCISNFSRGRRTIADTEFERTKEKLTIRTMTTSKSMMFINESNWFGLLKLNSASRDSLSSLMEFVARNGGPWLGTGVTQGSNLVTLSDRPPAASLRLNLYG
mmetsp:Transcript_98260/g.300458  ORF Transcript_98260/g.300458 Transcript_98260/m.300458 type:complete len:272 (+) Transcript_98260:962-1777(+)